MLMEDTKKLYQISQVRLLENIAINNYAMSQQQLMQSAGHAAFSDLIATWPHIQKIVVICGKGNNGGDGYVVANYANENQLEVAIRYVGDIPSPGSSAFEAYMACCKTEIDIKPFDLHEVYSAELIVDAIFGIGLHRALTSEYVNIIQKMNASNLPILAIDVPSGLNADTGQINGIAVKACVTSTFIALKCGMFTGRGPEFCGKIICHDLSIDPAAFATAQPIAHLIPYQKIHAVLPPRVRDANKGLFGHVLVVGGYHGMAGAARLAAEAALRAGAGLVSVATLPEHVAVITTERPEIMCHGVMNAKELQPLLQKATVVVLGPGLGTFMWSKEMLNSVFSCDKPLVVDADALNLLAENPQAKTNWILTPHPGEASRLLHRQVEEIQSNRFESVRALQAKYKGVSILKGAGTLVKSELADIGVCPAGNPGMSSAGMGDVLSGILGGLLAQKISLDDAAEVGVLIHAIAADQLAAKSGERGMIASDLMLEIKSLVN